ncbi:hypothetical protein D3C72_1068040 [compost metagenome]
MRQAERARQGGQALVVGVAAVARDHGRWQITQGRATAVDVDHGLHVGQQTRFEGGRHAFGVAARGGAQEGAVQVAAIGGRQSCAGQRCLCVDGGQQIDRAPLQYVGQVMPQIQDGRLAFPFVAMHAGNQGNGGAGSGVDPQHGDGDAAIGRFVGRGGDREVFPA